MKHLWNNVNHSTDCTCIYMKTEGTAPVEHEPQDRASRKERRQTASNVADGRQDFPLLFRYLQVSLFKVSKEDK